MREKGRYEGGRKEGMKEEGRKGGEREERKERGREKRKRKNNGLTLLTPSIFNSLGPAA